MENYLTTVRAIAVAVKGVNFKNKQDMEMRLRMVIGFVENALEEIKAEPLEYAEVYDDTNPDYIKSSIED